MNDEPQITYYVINDYRHRALMLVGEAPVGRNKVYGQVMISNEVLQDRPFLESGGLAYFYECVQEQVLDTAEAVQAYDEEWVRIGGDI